MNYSRINRVKQAFIYVGGLIGGTFATMSVWPIVSFLVQAFARSNPAYATTAVVATCCLAQINPKLVVKPAIYASKACMTFAYNTGSPLGEETVRFVIEECGIEDGLNSMYNTTANAYNSAADSVSYGVRQTRRAFNSSLNYYYDAAVGARDAVEDVVNLASITVRNALRFS